MGEGDAKKARLVHFYFTFWFAALGAGAGAGPGTAGANHIEEASGRLFLNKLGEWLNS